jgi:hypothetical protein
MKCLLLTMVRSRADRCIDLNDHGRSRGPRSVGGGSRLAVVVTVAKGYDLGYVWKTQGEAAGRAMGGYYLNAAQAGEPPGRWWGPGASALGLTPGQVVQRGPYEAVFRAAAEADTARKAATTAAPHSRIPWPPPTTPWASSTGSASRPSPRPWPTGRTGSRPPRSTTWNPRPQANRGAS